MGADHRPERMRQQYQRGDVEARLLLDLAVDFARALDHDDALQARPIVALLQPCDIVDCGVGSGFDTAMITVYGLMPTDRRIPESACFLLECEDLDILQQRYAVGAE
jgi:hypothetical protein